MTEVRTQHEYDLRSRVLDMLKPLHAVPIESPMQAGTPDVNCVVGWIELKHIVRWPKGDDSLIVPQHFTPHQRNWLRKRCQHGGKAWLLVRIERHWCLFWGVYAADWVGVTLTKGELLQSRLYNSVKVWETQPSDVDFIKALTQIQWK